MSGHSHKSKTATQIERMIFFSDAVFAIAITLLIIEIKVPHLQPEYSNKAIINAYMELGPKFLGFFTSFFFIGLYWTVHHQLMSYLVNYDQRLLWINLLYLVSIVLLPFSTALDSEYSGSNLRSPFLVYTLNILFAGYMIAALWGYISNQKRRLSEGLENVLYVKYMQKRALTVPVAFLIVFLIGLLIPFPYFGMSRILLVTIPFIMLALRKQYEKKPAVPVLQAEEVLPDPE
ncbi:putative membrane protein [Chitinophaga niastensis]|uniref:Putative membrane protein n=1 Tax=Chitinophaga niastensis TaxID=536980 RepID=A0A2P8HDS5_CHINA|nr:TMEM175 family protein [Chitinophaga niastensis]PSL44373.1 putative membrane protein [Chitinophaga niastensis]